jgi:uncharacterized protein with ParB-like and HNH nuclease domain
MSAAAKPISPPDSYQPEKRTIGELLSTTSPPIVVPDWQRSYSWNSSQVETFWSDLLDFERRNPKEAAGLRKYFLGSVVIVTTSEKQHLLLDGQQRIATSAILLSVIRDAIKAYKDDAAHRIQSRYLADIDDAQNETVYKLSLNVYDRDFFRRLILEYRDGSFVEPERSQASHRLIAEAREYFEGKFSEKAKSVATPEDAFKWALRIQDVLTNYMSVVAITSSDEETAAEVFETLNDRGIGLSTPDLLRNLVMRRAPANLRDDIVELWGDIIQFETDTEIRTFLRHYWISRHGDVKTQRLYREIRDHITGNDVQSLDISRDLKDAAAKYRDIVAARDDDAEVEALLKEIDQLGASVLYPIVLSTLEKVSAEKRGGLLRAVINLYVRHSVVGLLENSKLENVIHKIAVDIRGELNADDAIAALNEFAPDDDAFKSAFQRLSVSRTATQRYLLSKLESDKEQTEEHVVNIPDKVHVEHIYPQVPQDGQKWANHSQAINRIGNLTLLAKRLNVGAKNAPFADKKPYYEKSTILLTKELCANADWNFALLDDRQKKLSERIALIWPTPKKVVGPA